MKITKQLKLATAVAAATALMGCIDSSSDDGTCFEANDCSASGYSFPSDAIFVAPDAADGDDITEAFVTATTDLPANSVVVLPKGEFQVSATVTITSANGATITGHGIEATKLDFTTSQGDDGLFFQGGADVTIRDLGVYEAPKNGIKADSVNGIHFAYTATVWETPLAAETASTENGAYGLYPVSSNNVLVEYSYSKGSADAGIYVGQSNNIVVRHNVAEHNVAGIEIENSTNADVYMNKAFDNSGGILIFDLPGLVQASGNNIRIFDNDTYENNTSNVGTGVVGAVPQGTGVLVLASSGVEIYNNRITDNITSGVALTSYFLMDDDVANYGTNYGATIADGWSPLIKNISVHNNTFENNSDNPPSGTLLNDAILGYQSGMNASGAVQAVPAIIYDGIGELLSNANALSGFGYAPYTAADAICAFDNANNNDAGLNLNVGSVYGVNPTDSTISNFDGGMNPVPTLRISPMGEAATVINCGETTPTRLSAATVTIKGTEYGCEADDAELASCAL